MKTWMLWHGGSSYSFGGREDVEEFNSMAAAIRAFDNRYNLFDPYYPCVDNTSTAWLFLSDPNASGAGPDLYPDRVLSFGPRGGVIVERA